MSFFEELKRRNVIRVAIAYTITAWLVAQVLELLFDSFGAPDWVMKTIIVLMGFGLVFALILAWAYELTPDGIRRESDIDSSKSIAPDTANRLDRTIIVVLVLAVGYFVWESRFSGRQVEQNAATEPVTMEVIEPVATEPSIAVLPFADMSPEGDQAYFSDGISEELLNLLAHVNGLTVASRTSSFAFKGSQRGIADIAEELKVDHVLEGSVRKAGNRVRISAQLIDAKTDRHLWSDTFDRELNDIFAIQDEISNAIVNALKTELGLLAEAETITVQVDTKNLDAYQLFLEGHALFISRLNVGKSIKLLETAVELDSQFARAWEELGAAYAVAKGWGVLGEGFMIKSEAAARRALELNPKLSLAWAVLGESLALEGDLLGTIDSFNRAIENDPLNSTAWFWRGLRYALLGFHEQAVNDIEHCIELDPAYYNCYRHIAAMYAALGRNEDAIDAYRFALKHGINVNDFWIVPLYLRLGNEDAAAFALLAESRGNKSYPFQEFWEALANPGKVHSEGIRKLESWIDETGTPPAFRHLEWIIFGEYARVELGLDSYRLWLQDYQPFRASEYFKPLLTEIGVPAYWRERGFPPMCRPLGEEDFECD